MLKEEVKGSIWTLYKLNYSYRAIITSIYVAHRVKIAFGTVQYTIRQKLESIRNGENDDNCEDDLDYESDSDSE